MNERYIVLERNFKIFINLSNDLKFINTVRISTVFSNADWNERIEVFSVELEKYAKSIGQGMTFFLSSDWSLSWTSDLNSTRVAIRPNIAILSERNE